MNEMCTIEKAHTTHATQLKIYCPFLFHCQHEMANTHDNHRYTVEADKEPGLK